MEEIITAIAKNLGFDSLESQKSDELDFKEVNVEQIKKALEDAFKAGQKHKEVKEEVAQTDSSFTSNGVARRMRELAGIPHKDNFV